MGSLALAGLVLGALITGGIIGAAVMSVVHYEQARREMDAEQEGVPDLRGQYPNIPRRPPPPPMPPRKPGLRIEVGVMPPPPRKPGKRNPVDEWV
jgi:hypothetical protein